MMDSPITTATSVRWHTKKWFGVCQRIGRELQLAWMKILTPIDIHPFGEGGSSFSGLLICRNGGKLTVLLEKPIERHRAIQILLGGRVFLGEVISCEPRWDFFALDVVLIQTV